jgi:hypothetical protein
MDLNENKKNMVFPYNKNKPTKQHFKNIGTILIIK